MAASGTCTDKDEAATGDESGRSQQSPEIGDGGGGQPYIPMRRAAAALRRRGEETPQTGEGGEGTTWPRQESVPGVPSIACECMGSAMGRNSERIARASKVAGVGAPQCDTACAESGPQGCGAIGDRPTSDIDVSLLPARACPCLLSPRALTSESCNQRWANARPTRTARHARRASVRRATVVMAVKVTQII